MVQAARALLLAVLLLDATGALAAAIKCTPNLANVPKVSFPQHPEWQTVYDFAWSNWKRLILNNRKMYNQCWMDEGFGAGGATWQWDTNFGSIGARWGFTEFPVIETQENFYFAQQANGLIGQKLSEQSESFKATSLNPPFYAWVEWEYYLMTGDASHFTKVINGVPVYQRLRNHFYYFWNNASLHKADGSWVWSGIDSGRDCVSAGLWVDLPAQLATTAYYLAKIAQVVPDSNLYAEMLSRHQELSGFLNASHWNGLRDYYENRNTDGSFITNQDGPQGLWTLIGRVPDTRQLGLLSAQILDPAKLLTYHPVPSVSRQSPYYNAGCKWYGPTWPPDVITTVKGLSEQGQQAAAFAVALQDVEKTVLTYRSNGGHLCENYRSDRDGCYGGQDLTWGSAAYVVSLLDVVMGLRPNAPQDELAWTINLLEPYSIRNLRFGDNTVSLAYQGRNRFADGVQLEITTNSRFTLTVNVPERVENGSTIPARSCGPVSLLVGSTLVQCPAP